jgi:hypothetical protein
MNPFEMVVIIVAIVMGTSLMIKKMEYRRSQRPEIDPRERRENERLRHEVTELKERLKVLERITVEKENSLSREIEELRDR